MEDDASQGGPDHRQIKEVVRVFFASFHRDAATQGSFDRLPSLFAPGATITVLAEGGLRVHDVPAFLLPRRDLLLGASLTAFAEWETEGRTLVGRDIACRRSRYAKKGVRDGEAFTGGGTKVFAFVRRGGEWKILSLLWQDD
jgi:hypothetical protein